MKKLTKDDLDQRYTSRITIQEYSPRPKIDGVAVYEIKNFVGEDGDFSELARLSPQGEMEQIPKFKVAQISRSKLIPGAIKAWHLHLNQEDVWYVPPADHILVGLADLRKDSSSGGIVMRLVMGGGKSQLLYIPRGVAHGSANVSEKEATLIYFTNQQFDPQNPDEHRLPWDTFGKDFWQVTRG